MGANQLQSKALALEPVEVPAPAAEPARPVAATPRAENKTQRELRITTADEFLATAAREYEEGTVDQALWRRAVEQCRDNPSLVVAAYLRARATELKSRHNAEASVAEDRADEDPNRDEPGGQPSAMVSTFLRGIAPDSPKSKVVWWAAAAVALAAVVAVIFIMVSPPAREPDQGRTAAVAATASPQPAAPARAQPATRAPGSEANGDQTRVALAATVQRLRNDGNWNVLVLYAAEWTRKEPENAVAWRELSGGYARLHQYNDALDAGNRAVQLAPSDALAWRSLGQINLTVDRLPEAGVAFDKALALNPGDADALCGAASVAQRQSRPKVTDASSRTVPAAGGCSGPGAGDIVVAPIGTSSVKVVSSGGR